MLKYDKNILIIIFITLYSGNINIFGKNYDNNEIDTAKVKYLVRQLEDGISNYKEIKGELNESVEGGELLGYLGKGEYFRKIEARYYGETGKHKVCYYFDEKENIFFISDSLLLYNKPIYEENIRVKQIQTNNYYFNHKRLMLWFSDQKKVNSKKYKYKEIELLNDIKELIINLQS